MPIMFDPSRYIPDMAGYAASGQRLGVESSMAATQALQRQAQHDAELRLQRQRYKMENDAAMAMLAEKQAGRQALGQRFDDRMQLSRAKFGADEQQRAYERGEKQRATTADLVASLVGPTASGNTNVLEAARAAAQARDPSLRVQLPGERDVSGPEGQTPGSMSFTVDEAYPEDVNKLRLSRGGQPVYTSPDANEMRRREAEMAALRVGPIAGSDWGISALNLAGKGADAAEAARLGTAGYNAQENRETAERVAGVRLQQQRDMAREQRDERRPTELHKLVEGMTKTQLKQAEKISTQDRELSLAEAQLASPDPLEQRRAIAGVQRAYSGLAQTNAERKDLSDSAGKVEAFKGILNTWLGGAELPEDFHRQMANMLRNARVESRRQIVALGEQARDNVYASRGLRFGSARELAEYGNQAFQRVTGTGLTDEELDAEAAQLEQRYPGRFTGRPATPGPLPLDGLSPDAFAPPPGDALPAPTPPGTPKVPWSAAERGVPPLPADARRARPGAYEGPPAPGAVDPDESAFDQELWRAMGGE